MIVQSRFSRFTTRLARVTVALVASSASSRRVAEDNCRTKSSLNRSSKLNSLSLPPCSDGTSWKDAVRTVAGSAARVVADTGSESAFPLFVASRVRKL